MSNWTVWSFNLNRSRWINFEWSDSTPWNDARGMREYRECEYWRVCADIYHIYAMPMVCLRCIYACKCNSNSNDDTRTSNCNAKHREIESMKVKHFVWRMNYNELGVVRFFIHSTSECECEHAHAMCCELINVIVVLPHDYSVNFFLRRSFSVACSLALVLLYFFCCFTLARLLLQLLLLMLPLLLLMSFPGVYEHISIFSLSLA